MASPPSKLSLTTAWKRNWFTTPSTDQVFWASATVTQGPSVATMAAVGPTPHLRRPRRGLVAVGRRTIGPTPQTTPALPQETGSCGERKRESVESPSPVFRLSGPIGTSRTGRTKRGIRFHFWLNFAGQTGWRLRDAAVRSNDPAL